MASKLQSSSTLSFKDLQWLPKLQSFNNGGFAGEMMKKQRRIAHCQGSGSGVAPGPKVRPTKPILLFRARSCPFLDCRTSSEHRLVSFELPSSMCECFVKFRVLCYTMCLTFTNVRETRVCFGNSSNYRCSFVFVSNEVFARLINPNQRVMHNSIIPRIIVLR
ncbi:hypothetical protein E3N88_24008 [Mikania micrantha]|uniref:Uncharacterized protein n=1 Tax=Mikania micrantha TaxID=192012 RepID=A0A5N6NGZ4_9ASTR|nr:hypothetical protein E3N88_24008 [Mikania micrantha]